MNTAQLLNAFPKQRPPLGEAYKKIFEGAYKDSREGHGVITKMALKLEEWMHRQVAEPPQTYPVLEIGAGTFNHLRFETITGPYDAIEPFTALFQDKTHVTLVRNIYADISAVPHTNIYKRIISVAVLEHLTELPAIIARSALLLDPEGEFRAGIPTEGGLLWYLAWRFGTGLGFWLRHKLSYKPMMKYEHVNTAAEIAAVVQLFYHEVAMVRFPLWSKHLSFYTYIKARRPKVDTALHFLEKCAHTQ